MLASALQRLWLYVDAFGATRLRFLVQAQLLWLAAVFAALLVAGARRAGQPPPAGVVVLSALAALLFAASDPDRRIAERNVDRWAETGRLDVRHANVLSADAAPALAALPDDLAACATRTSAPRSRHPTAWRAPTSPAPPPAMRWRASAPAGMNVNPGWVGERVGRDCGFRRMRTTRARSCDVMPRYLRRTSHVWSCRPRVRRCPHCRTVRPGFPSRRG